MQRPTRRPGRPLDNAGPARAVQEDGLQAAAAAPAAPIGLRNVLLVWSLAILLFGIAVVTRTHRLMHPPEVVFDEVHFGEFINQYLKGEYFFDIHPPLAKLFFAAVAKAVDLDPHSFAWEDIGAAFPHELAGKVFYLRLTSAIFGCFIVPLAFFTLLELDCGLLLSFTVAVFFLCDQSLCMVSRYIFTDSQLMFYLALAVFSFLRLQKAEGGARTFWAVCCGLALGGGISVKWTFLATLGCVGLYQVALATQPLIQTLKQSGGTVHKPVRRPRVRQSHSSGAGSSAWEMVLDFHHFKAGCIMLLCIVCVYLACWVAHFYLLYKPGPGCAFMTSKFNARLDPSASKDAALGFLSALAELHGEMFRANSGVTSEHFWGTYWWQWPIMSKGLSYWQATQQQAHARLSANLYLLGNPFAWWISSLCMVAVAVKAATAVTQRLLAAAGVTSKETSAPSSIPAEYLLLAVYLMNLLPYVLVSRVCFIYHYLPPLYFAYLTTALVLRSFLDAVCARLREVDPWHAALFRGACCLALVLLVASAFVFFIPWTYGLFLTEQEHNSRRWLASWV